MKLRTVAILILMACIVVITSAFGAYQDGIEKEKDNNHDRHVKKHDANKKDNPKHSKELVGAAGAGTSYKQSNAHLDVSEKVDGPYVKDGPNSYRGKAGGYDLRDTYYSDSEDDSDDSDDDNDGKPMTDFQRKIKYIKKMFKEIFSKWKSQESIMAPSSVEEDLDNPLGPGGGASEGFKIREKFKKGARQGMRKLKNAFRGRFKS
jgi:hypothetical protein